MADIKQDLLSLQYSQIFNIEGIQEANIDLELPPLAGLVGHGVRRCHRRHKPDSGRCRQAL